ncbi:hypothetical protein QO179_24170 [Bacillus stercoris]|nr:hypothetical protein [Bacillus stercoris]
MTYIKIHNKIEDIDHSYESIGGSPYLSITMGDTSLEIQMSKKDLNDFIQKLIEAKESSKVKR